MPLNRRLAHGAWFSILRRWIADVSPPHVHGDCSYQGAYSRHLPLWSRPTNMRQARSQTKLMHVKANVVPSHLRVSHGTILPVYAKTRSPGNINLCLGSKHLGRIQAYQGKIEEITKIQMARGGGGCQATHIWWPPSAMHCATHENQPACNPMPKPKPDTQRTPPKGYQNDGGQPIGLTWQPSPM